MVIKQLRWSHIPVLRRRNQEKWMKLWASNYFYILSWSAWWREHLFGHKVLINQSQHVMDVIISKVPASPAVVCTLSRTHFLIFKLCRSDLFVVVFQWSQRWDSWYLSVFLNSIIKWMSSESYLLWWWALAWSFKVLYIFHVYPYRGLLKSSEES